jgi:hypothetical protein
VTDGDDDERGARDAAGSDPELDRFARRGARRERRDDRRTTFGLLWCHDSKLRPRATGGIA